MKEQVKHTDKKMIIGTNQISYLQERNFIELPFRSNIAFKKVYDYQKIRNHILFKLQGKIDPNRQFSFQDFGLNKVDFYHFFSSVYLGKKPWVVTSSVPVPRWSKSIESGLKALSKPNCKRIILLSDCCLERQKQLLDEYPKYREPILSKTEIIHPSQPTLIGPENIADVKHKIKFIIVGHQILIKGGLEIIQAFKQLQHEGYNNYELTIVSKLHKSGFLDYDESADDIAFIKKEIDRNENIIHFDSLPNSDVLDLLIESNVALLPSYGDSYGYSVLESQATGTPVITTNVCALSEINNTDLGWMLEVPLIEGKRADSYTREKRNVFSETLKNALYDCIKDILENPDQIKDKALKSLSKIVSDNNPNQRAEAIEKIYTEIMREK